MKPPALTGAFLAGVCAVFTHAAIWELPRSTSAMPVQALVTCQSPRCEVAEHCARYDRWDAINDADFRNEWTMENGEAITTPKRASHNLLCALSIREGQTSVRPIRYLRVRDDDGTWRYVSATRDWGLRERVSAEAPATEYDFYQLVKGKRLCFGTCAARDEYVYFSATEFRNPPDVDRRRFTHFAPGEGSAQGDWDYVASTTTSGSVTLYYGTRYETDLTCWVTLEFQTDESGTYSTSCDDEGNTTDSGSWIVTGR